MKLILATTRDESAGKLIDRLVEHEFRATQIKSVGGFLKRGNSTVVVGIDDEYVDDVLKLIRESASPANVYVVNLARYERI
ncbi:MAG: cyclic-di-AMP receptor [Chloroflexota bacterium]